jgi:hypothetical protein
MAQFSQTQQDQIRQVLGYPPQRFGLILPDINLDFPQTYVDRGTEILAELDDINNRLKSARANNMALELDGIKVDYLQHRRLLKADYSALLIELSDLTNTPIFSSGCRPLIQYQ